MTASNALHWIVWTFFIDVIIGIGHKTDLKTYLTLSIDTLDEISSIRYFWVLWYTDMNQSINETVKNELNQQWNTLNLTLIPYFRLNTGFINWQHITTQYRNYLQVTCGPVSAYMSSFCTFQCMRTRTASHTLYLKPTGRSVPSLLLYYVCVPVSGITGS